MINLYPLGYFSGSFVDILSEEDGHVLCITSLDYRDELSDEELNIEKECIVWDEEGYPDIYVKGEITFEKAQKWTKILEKEQNHRYKYKLNKTNYLDLDPEKQKKFEEDVNGIGNYLSKK